MLLFSFNQRFSDLSLGLVLNGLECVFCVNKCEWVMVLFSYNARCIFTHTNMHTNWHAHTLPFTRVTHAFAQTHTHSLSLTHSHTHTHARTHTREDNLSLSLTHMMIFFLSQKNPADLGVVCLCSGVETAQKNGDDWPWWRWGVCTHTHTHTYIHQYTCVGVQIFR